MSTIASVVRRRRRTALAAVLALAGLPLLVTSGAEAAEIVAKPCPDQAVPCVSVLVIKTIKGEVTEVPGASYTVNIEENADLTSEAQLAYKRRVRQGGSITPVSGITKALSIKGILAAAGVQFDRRFSETPNKYKAPSLLSAEQLTDSYTAPGNLRPAVYVTSTGGIGYVRPLADKYDVNAGDLFTTGKRLVLTIHTTGDLLDVDIRRTPKKITTKTPVSFSAKVTPNSDNLTYEWKLGSEREKSATPSYTFEKKGSYAINLEVRDLTDGSYGRASTATVKVGNPPKPKPTPTAGTGGGGGTGGGTGGGGSGYIPPFVPNTPDIPSDDVPEDDTPVDEFPTAPVDDGLEEVEGFVLAGAGSEMGESIPGTEAAAQPTEANELSTTRKISGAAIGTLAVLLLLGLGAEIETRWLSTRLGHLRRRA